MAYIRSQNKERLIKIRNPTPKKTFFIFSING